MVLGTPSYMSPEQLAGKKVDGRSDLFSLGVTLFQLVTGQLPFQGDSMATLMFRIANDPHPDIMALRPDAPPCLRAIVDRVLQKDVEQRYQRGTEMARDLRACAAQAASNSGAAR
jgi:serine/threonine-protein kinase